MIFSLHRQCTIRYDPSRLQTHLMKLCEFLLFVSNLDPKQPTKETRNHPELCLLNDDHPAENEIEEEERVDGQEGSVFLDLGTTQKVHRG